MFYVIGPIAAKSYRAFGTNMGIRGIRGCLIAVAVLWFCGTVFRGLPAVFGSVRGGF